jgi:hypothetical protein
MKINEGLVSRLTDAARNRNVKILMVCRKNDLKPDQCKALEQIPNLDLRYNERVHAKCYYNDDCMVITSLNLYESSLGENHEMGVLLRKGLAGDSEAFIAAKKEAQFIIRESTPHVRSTQAPAPRAKEPVGKAEPEAVLKREPSLQNTIVRELSNIFGTTEGRKQGHCIKCGIDIPFNVEAPYCARCYKTWKKYKNEEYPQEICHSCGQAANTSMKHPLCSSCFARQKSK